MNRLEPGAATDAGELRSAWAPVPPEQVLGGTPSARHVDLDAAAGRTLGVWEHTPGVSTDVESDEVFVVLSGSGILSFAEPELPPIELKPGVIVRLTAGMRTVWTVERTLRKVYVTP